MKVSSRLLLIFLLVDCQVPWYRQLPPGEVINERSYIGKWKKKTNPRSAINSSWHKNQWSEEINFVSTIDFTKIYESKNYIGDSLLHERIEGIGTYQRNKNWLLLKTFDIHTKIYRDGQLIENKIRKVTSSLLYYYYQDENLIIPMIYDMGYNEMDFGVKDGVVVPYDEKNSNFFRYIKIYAFKEFQSHAYYPEK